MATSTEIPPKQDHERAARLALAALTVAFYGATIWRFFNYVQDDAFITLRYALEHKLGNGWVLSPGDRVEGYTSPLHLWLTTLILAHGGIDTTIFVLKFIGVMIGAAILVLTQRLTRLVLPDHPRLAYITPLVVAWHPGFGISMINAMETSLAALFLMYGIFRFVQEEGSPNRSQLVSLITFIAAALTRPELVVIFPSLLIASRRNRRGLVSGIAYVIVLACFEACRYHMYHAWLPNTYYAKWNPVSQIGVGLYYFGFFGLPTLTVIGFPLVIVGFVVMYRQARAAAPGIVAALVYMAFVVTSGGDWMHEGRFVTPILPVLAIAIVAGGRSLLKSIVRRLKEPPAGFSGWRLVVLGLYALFFFDSLPRWQATSAIVGSRNLAQTLKPQPEMLRWSSAEPAGRIKMARWIAEHARPGQLVATSELGVVSVYNPSIHFLDFRGLADARISHMTDYPHGRYGVMIYNWMNPRRAAASYLLSRRPDYIVIVNDNDNDSTNYPAAKVYKPSGTFFIQLDQTGQIPILILTWARSG